VIEQHYGCFVLSFQIIEINNMSFKIEMSLDTSGTANVNTLHLVGFPKMID